MAKRSEYQFPPVVHFVVGIGEVKEEDLQKYLEPDFEEDKRKGA